MAWHHHAAPASEQRAADIRGLAVFDSLTVSTSKPGAARQTWWV